MATYQPGDFVKVDFGDDLTADIEWMWVIVEECDEQNHVVFGRLDSQPLLDSTRLKLGQKVAVKFEKIRQHKRSDAWGPV